MKILRYIFLGIPVLMMSTGLTGCFSDNEPVDYTEWKATNEKYFSDTEAKTGEGGEKLFERIEPSWCPGIYSLAQWHNDRSLTKGNLVPMDNSTVDVIYECLYVDGTVLDTSYRNTTYGDSVYRCKPSDNIIGFWSMLTSMHVGDSVTCVIPSNAAYGVSSASVLPYSTLIYNMKLKAIHKYNQ